MSLPISAMSRILERKLLYLGAGLSMLSALFHLWIMQDHFAEWWGYGVFFLALANAQWAYGLALLHRPGRNLVLGGIAGTLAVIALYLVNHTAGLPLIGPHPGVPERVEVAGLASKALEIALVFVLLALLQDFRMSRPLASLPRRPV